jgi:hypothetical protein
VKTKIMAETKHNKVVEFLTAPTTIITVVGTGIGIGEALLFYNLGQKQGLPLIQKFKGWKLPPKKDLIETVSVVIITSIMTGVLTDLLMRGLQGGGEYMAQTGREMPKLADNSKTKTK